MVGAAALPLMGSVRRRVLVESLFLGNEGPERDPDGPLDGHLARSISRPGCRRRGRRNAPTYDLTTLHI